MKRLLHRAANRVFLTGDAVGIHVLPKHYYSSVPDHAWLNANKPLWNRRTDLTGVEWDLDAQLEWLREHCSKFEHEVRGLATYNEATRRNAGPGFGPIESQVLHCVLRSVRPRRYIEVGSGVSTVCALAALESNKDAGASCSVTCFEPHPSRALAGLQGVTLLAEPVQAVPLSLFETLESGDVLFIDSTHSVKTGSDVLFLYLDVLPRLRAGVLVHLHDIFLPFLYRRDVLQDVFDWQETALLLALLKGNRALRVECCLSALHYDRRAEFRKVLPDYQPQEDDGHGLAKGGGDFPCSMWLQVGAAQA